MRAALRVTRPELHRLFEELLAEYGPQAWWPGDSPFEIAAGALLVQRTQWRNAALAIENLSSSGLMTAEAVVESDPDDMESLISAVGFYRQKAARLRSMASWILQSGGFETLSRLPTAELRPSLLSVPGIGQETADSILLYAFARPVFIADAYARRLFMRMGWINGSLPSEYGRVRDSVMSVLDEDAPFYNEFHALIVCHGKAVCRSQPVCESCPARNGCDLGLARCSTGRRKFDR